MNPWILNLLVLGLLALALLIVPWSGLRELLRQNFLRLFRAPPASADEPGSAPGPAAAKPAASRPQPAPGLRRHTVLPHQARGR